MEVIVDNEIYESVYFPFSCIGEYDDFAIYELKLPSGALEEVTVFDIEEPLNSLRDYSEFLIREFILEEDIALTPRALILKRDLQDLFVCKEI